jgi:hypothetical protein
MNRVTEASAAVTAERCTAQLLSGSPARTAVDVVRRLLAVQGQDPRGVRLAIRARSAGLTAADVDRGLTQDRSLLISWLNRGTLHLVAAEDYWWLHALTTPSTLTGNLRRLTQEGGISADVADRAVAVIDAALAADGPLTRGQLGERIDAAGIRTQGQALVHLLARATARGLIVRGPMIGREQAFARVSDWLGAAPARFDRDVALAELARRYLAGHGPASERDLAKWAGLPLRDARQGLTAIASELADRTDGLAQLADRTDGLAQLAPSGAQRGGAQRGGSLPTRDQPGPGDLPVPRLLGSFDPLLHGWTDREPVLGTNRDVITLNGVFRPFALVNGRAVATWTLTGGRVELAPFDPLPESVTAALRTDAADVIRFLGYARTARILFRNSY